MSNIWWNGARRCRLRKEPESPAAPSAPHTTAAILREARLIGGDLGDGLHGDRCPSAVRRLRQLLGADAVLLADLAGPVAQHGPMPQGDVLAGLLTTVYESGSAHRQAPLCAAPLVVAEDLAGCLVVSGADCTEHVVAEAAGLVSQSLGRAGLRSAPRPDSSGVSEMRSVAGSSRETPDELTVVEVGHGRRTVFVCRDDIQFVEAHGDYVRLHTAEEIHLIRLSLSHLEDIWAPAGFVRVHRGYLVAIGWVHDLRVTGSAGLVAGTPAGDVPVSRRHARGLKERLKEAARSGRLGESARWARQPGRATRRARSAG